MFKVIVKTGFKINKIVAEKDQNLLKLLRDNKILIDTPCNGKGTCGKCFVKINSGYLPDGNLNELAVLGTKLIEEGYRLSCCYKVQSDLEIEFKDYSLPATIVTEGVERELQLSPIVTKQMVTLEKPGLSSQTADYQRVLSQVLRQPAVDLKLIRQLPEILRKHDFTVTLVKMGDCLLSVESGNTTNTLYGVAVDIGTTTLVTYLIDLNTGKKIAVHSLLNPQKIYGSDVISRINHTLETGEGLDEMQALVINAINDSIVAMCEEADIFAKDIYMVTLVGNTTMIHFLLKISAKNIAAAPFIPVITSPVNINAGQIGININAYGVAYVLPSVSAYIGADTVSAVLSTGIYQSEEISLLIDIGTNGEIVLGNSHYLFACSSAAGPAFEGANIRNGMGSVKGAINKVSLQGGLDYTTIGNARPVGICGTGIVDAVAQMLEVGIIDDTGRLEEELLPVIQEHSRLVDRLTKVDGMNAFALTENIAITQKDIRELQNAKAAIAAGINILVKQAGISFEQINNVYLAGGFGTYMNADSAVKIGLIPEPLKGKIRSVGNAAGQGAIESLISSTSLTDTIQISKNIKYIELSASKDFNEYYVDCMMF